MKGKQPALVFFSFLVYLFLLGPLVIIVVTSFGSGIVLKFPPEELSLRWYKNIFDVQMFVKTFSISMAVSLGGNILAVALGMPAAYSLSRSPSRSSAALNVVFLSPALIPGIVLGFAMLNYLIVAWHLPLVLGLLIGHTVIMLPFIVRVLASSLAHFDFAVEDAALSLGSGRLKAFFSVVLPNIRSGVIAAVLVAFLESFNNVDISVYMTGPGFSTLPIEMLSYVENNFDPTIAAISVLLMVMTGGLMFLIDRLSGLSYLMRR